jgi:hypothetical protein
MPEVNVALLAFVERYAGTPIKWDIVALFAENPGLRDDAAHIAARLGRAAAPVARELDDLTLLGLLDVTRPAARSVYYLAADGELRARLAEFAAQGRRAAVGRVGD